MRAGLRLVDMILTLTHTHKHTHTRGTMVLLASGIHLNTEVKGPASVASINTLTLKHTSVHVLVDTHRVAYWLK